MKTNPRVTNKQRRRLVSSDSRLLRLIKQSTQEFVTDSADDLSRRFNSLRDQAHKNHGTGIEDTVLVTSFALMNESLRRTVNMSAYDVQILAGLAMARGAIAEMQTGEGKTLTSAFPIVAHTLSGNGVHVATVNAYLAQRDFEFLRPALNLLGISAGISLPGDAPNLKRMAYDCDVTFATGYELGFDFLRDQIAMRGQGVDRLGAKLRNDLFGSTTETPVEIQRGFAAAIIDEIDSVFIDEAITPLVLSSGSLGAATNESVYRAAKWVVDQLTDEHFTLDIPNKALDLTLRGLELAHELQMNAFSQGIGMSNGTLVKHQSLLRPWQNYIESALRAKHLMIRDVNYIVREQRVEIVDEYTGRIFADRNWRDGLHQAVEAKEDLPITEERKTIAKISRQRFFQRYDVLCGMTGTADGHQTELQKCYRLPVAIIPRRKPLLRTQLLTRYFDSAKNKIEAIILEVAKRNAIGQPVLIGTRTIEQSLQISSELTNRAVPHQTLNGVQDEDEASLIANAGSFESVTVATNMAGRGTDIKPDDEALNAGGLHVIGFEHNSSVRIDRQLLGRAGRQGDPGSGQFFACADDDIVIRFDPALAKLLRRIKTPTGRSNQVFDRRIQSIQKIAERASYQSRQNVMREELWLDKVKKAAG